MGVCWGPSAGESQGTRAHSHLQPLCLPRESCEVGVAKGWHAGGTASRLSLPSEPFVLSLPRLVFYSHAHHQRVLATKLPSLLLVTHLCLFASDGDFIPSLWTLSLKGVPHLQDP